MRNLIDLLESAHLQTEIVTEAPQISDTDHHWPASDPRTPSEVHYPELQEIAMRIANETCKQINSAAQVVESAMPYKAQFILEQLIKILEERV